MVAGLRHNFTIQRVTHCRLFIFLTSPRREREKGLEGGMLIVSLTVVTQDIGLIYRIEEETTLFCFQGIF